MENYKTYLVEVTPLCNLKCKYCFYETGVKREAGFLDLSILYGLKNKKIWLTGGEAFLHPEIEEAIKIIGKKNELNVFTNGILLSNFDLDLFKNIKKLFVSIDSPDKEVNDYYRTGTPDISLLQKLNSLDGLEVTLKKTITKKNYHNLDKYFSEFLDLGFKRFSFNTVYIPSGHKLCDELSIEENEEEQSYIFETLNRWKEKVYIAPHYLNAIERYNNKTLNVASCPALRGEACFIDHNGNTHMCIDREVISRKKQGITPCEGFPTGVCLGMWETFE